MIARIAAAEPDRLARFLVRPNKLLARQNWAGTAYRARYSTKEAMQALFDKLPLDVFIVRMNPPAQSPLHATLLRDMVLAFPGRWRLVASFRSDASQSVYAAYEPVKLRAISSEELQKVLRDSLDDSRKE